MYHLMPQNWLDEDRRKKEARVPTPPPGHNEATRRAAVEADAQLEGWAHRLRTATNLDEIARLLDAGNYTPSGRSAWRPPVEETWQRLSKAGVLGPPSHDIAIVRCQWPVHGKPQRLIFEEMSRQAGWLVLDAQPFCFREGFDIREEATGRMDVWIAANGTTFRREEVYRGNPQGGRAAHDATLSYYLKNDARHHPVAVAVPRDRPPRTKEVSGFLKPRETRALLETILLTTQGSRGGHSLDHNLGTALAAALHQRPPASPAR
jgi:hypothetical protein